MGRPLSDAMGGPAAIDIAVGVFYRKLLIDSTINHFFDNIDARMLKGMQRDFLIMAMGGPCDYASPDVRAAHAHLLEKGLRESHVETAIGHLKATLEELRVPISVAAQIMAAAGDVRSEVFERRSG